jgi:hypothetical protein
LKCPFHREEVEDFFGFKDRDCLSFEEFMGKETMEETTLGSQLT